MFFLRDNLFSVIIPDKFCYYRTSFFSLFFFFLLLYIPNTMCTIIANSVKSISRSLFIIFNTSLLASSLLLSSTPWMSKQLWWEYCPRWSTFSSTTFDLSIKADTFSFKSFIIFLLSCYLSYSSYSYQW